MEDVTPEQQMQANGVVEDAEGSAAPASAPSADASQTTSEAPATPAAPPNPLLEKYNEYWGVVRENPGDFQTWTQLIATVEKLDDIVKAREVFDNFLAEYPLCYGYWKKYADAENKHQNAELAAQVYQRGVASVPYSVDLWGHYATFKQQQPGATPDQTREVFELAVAYVGGDYLAHGLWDKYLQFEGAQGSTLHVASLYSRILGYPIRDIDRYFQSFKDFASSQTAAGLMTVEEMNNLKEEIEIKKTAVREAERVAAAERAAAAAKALEAEAAAAKVLEAEAAAAKAVEAEAAAAKAAETEAAAAKAEAEPAAAETDAVAAEAVPAAALPLESDEAVKPAEEATAVADDTVMAEPDTTAQEPADVKMEEAPITEPKQEEPAIEAGETGVKDEPIPASDQEMATGETSAVAQDVEAAVAKPEDDATAVGAAGSEEAPKAEEAIVVTDDELKAAWLKLREDLHKRTKEELSKRKPYEDQIKRPYFHVKPLDNSQLTNWAKYLDFTEKQGNMDACLHLYERCLVACAAYPEFWQRYVRFLERNKSEAASAALQRALQVFCKRRAEMHLFAARYQERHGDVEAARATYHHLLTQLSPGLLPALLAAGNFEQRMGNKQAACQLYEDVIREERSKESSTTYAFLVVQYAHFLQQMYQDIAKAREMLDEALSHLPSSRILWDGAIFLEEVARAPDMAKRVLGLYEQCTVAPVEAGKGLSEREREELSARAVEFADMYGDAATLAEVEYTHASRFMLPLTSTSDASRKRTAAEAGASGATHPPAKHMKAEAHAASSVPLPAAPAVPPLPAVPPMPAAPAVPPAPMVSAGYYAPAAPAAAPYNYAGYYGQYPGYAGYGYGY